MAHGNRNSGKAKATERKLPPAESKPPERPGPGRPPGSSNIDYEKCVTVPAKCRKCGSTEFGPRRHVVSRMIGGVVDGQEYNCVSHYNTKCANQNCNQATRIIEYRMVPVAGEEAGHDQPADEIAGDGSEADEEQGEVDDALDLDAIFAEESGT